MTIVSLLAQINRGDLKNIQTDNPLTPDSISAVLQIVFGIAGGIALIIIVLAGLKYTLSLGDSQGTAQAKNAIIYALIGLAVCILGYSIVTFVLDKL